MCTNGVGSGITCHSTHVEVRGELWSCWISHYQAWGACPSFSLSGPAGPTVGLSLCVRDAHACPHIHWAPPQTMPFFCVSLLTWWSLVSISTADHGFFPQTPLNLCKNSPHFSECPWMSIQSSQWIRPTPLQPPHSPFSTPFISKLLVNPVRVSHQTMECLDINSSVVHLVHMVLLSTNRYLFPLQSH